MIHTCPRCGQKLNVEIKALTRPGHNGAGTTFESTAKTFPNIAETTALPHPLAHSETPAHLPNQESHVKVPIQQALITAGLASPIIGICVSLFVYNFAHFTIGASILAGLISISVSFFIVCQWKWSSKVGFYDNLLWRTEEFLNVDLDGDKQIGKPEPQHIQVEFKDGKRWKYATLPGDALSLHNFALSVVRGWTNFSENGASNTSYGVTDFRALRDVFLVNNWAFWRNPKVPRQGAELTLRGKAVLRDIARNQPEDEDYENIS